MTSAFSCEFPIIELETTLPLLAHNIKQTAKYCQVPLETAFTVFLAYANHPVMRSIQIRYKEVPEDLTRMINAQDLFKYKIKEELISSSLFIMLIADTGERKTTTENFFKPALQKIKKQLYIYYEEEREELEKFKFFAKFDKEYKKKYKIKKESILYPRTIFNGGTAKSLEKIVSLGYPYISVFSSHAIPKEVRDYPKLQDRINFSLYLGIIPYFFEKIKKHKDFISRCLIYYANPRGFRDYEDWNGDQIKSFFEDRFTKIYNIYTGVDNKRTISLSRDSQQIFLDDFLMKDALPFKGIDGFIDRKCFHLLKLATTLQIFNDENATEISEEIFRLSIKLFKFYAHQQVKALSLHEKKDKSKVKVS